MATLEDIMKKHNIPVKQKPQPTNAGFKLLDQASLKQPVPKYVPEKKTKSFSEFAAQGNPGWEVLAVPGYGAYRLGQLLPESVRKWGTRAGETGGEIMTLSHLPERTSTGSTAGDVSADLLGNVMGFVTNPRGGVQSLGAGLWRGTEGAVGALLPKVAPKITKASPVVQTGIRSGITSVPWEATYAGVNDRPMSAGEMGLAVGANVGLDMLTHGLARGVGRKAPAPAERSASYDYLVDMEPASTAEYAPWVQEDLINDFNLRRRQEIQQALTEPRDVFAEWRENQFMQPWPDYIPPQGLEADFTVDPLGNATKGRPLQALPSGTKPLALPPGRQPLALPGGEPKMLNAGQNWEFGTGYPKEGYWFADPFGVVRGTPETALALPEGLPTSPALRLGGKKGQLKYPSAKQLEGAMPDHVRFKQSPDQDLNILREAMTKRVGPLRIGKVDLAPEAFTKPDFKAAQTIADKLGLRLVAFKGTGHRGMQQGRTIYLNQNMKDPLDYVFWHEVGHTMEVTHPQHYDNLMGIALEHMQDADGLLKHYKEFGYAMEDMPHEFAADVFAEALHSPGFFARVAEKSPEVLKPLLEAIDSLIANIKAMVSKDDTVLPYLKDLEKLRERIYKEVAEPYFRDAMGEKEFVDTFGQKWTAAKAKGGRIEPTPIDTPVFRRWFEGSKVVDEQGRPLVVYHNTSADFNAFDVSKARQSQDIPGIFFSDSPTEWADMGDRQIQAYLSIKNPYTGDYTTYKGIRGGSTDTAFREIRDALIKDGYDGIITRDGDTTEYIAFFPGQIKSVYNRGTWDPTNPDIRYKLNQTSPLDDLKSMIEYGAANLRGGRASFEKAIRQQFGKQLEGYSPEVINRLLNDVWHDARELQQKGETVLKFQGQEIPLKRGEVAQPTAKAATTGEGGLLEGLDINPSELRDISGRQAGWRDIWRNMRDTFGDKFPEIEKRILYPLEDAKAAWVDHQRALTDDLYTNVVDGLGIKKGSRESELVQLYGEGGYRHWESAPKSEQSRQRWLANLERKYGRQNVEFTGDGAYVNEPFDYNDLVNEVGAERAADIVQAENWFRQKYDELLDQVNTVREQLYPGQQDKLVPKRQDYFHHFREMEGVEGVMNLFDTSAQISPELAGKSMSTKPKTKFAGFMQQRGLGKYKPDAVGGFLEYVPSATYAIHMDPQGAAFRQLENELVKTMGGNTGINKFLEYLKYYADDIQGKTNFFDRNWQFLTSRELFQGLVALNNRIKGNMVLGNAGTMVSQVFNMPQGIAFAKQHSAPGLTRYLSSLIKRMADPEGFAATNPMAESRFLKERFSGDMYRRFATKPGEKAKNVAVIGMEDIDRFATEFIWSAAYEKALHTKGITDPVRYADYHTRRLVAGRGVGEVPLMQKSKIVQLVAPFQVEVGNLLNVIGDMRVDKDWIGAFVALPLTLWLFNRGSEAVKGMPVALDPIEAVQEAIQIALDDTKDDKALRIFGRLAGEFLGNMPLGQTVAALYPEYGFKAGDKQLPTRKEFFGREDPTRYGSGLLIARAIQDPLYKAVFPWGGAQAKKTVQGIDALRKGGSYTNKDQLRYPISTDPVNALKGVVFGPSGFRETDPYYEADRRPLSEKQTEKVQKSRSPKEAYEGIHRTRKINALKQNIKDIDKDKKLSPEEKKKKIAILKLELQKVKAGY